MTDAELLARLEDASLPEHCFRHRDHLRAAYLYLACDGFLRGLDRMATALRHYAVAKGKAERYHETVTIAYGALIHERMRQGGHMQGGHAGGFEAFLAANAELLDPTLLSRFYSPETLASPRARDCFVLQERGA